MHLVWARTCNWLEATQLDLKMVQLLKLYTLEEVAEHDQVDDAWIVIGKNVLDVTSFLMEVSYYILIVWNLWINPIICFVSQHPGGDVILDYCGTDATEVFNDADHSPFAVGKFKEYKIGELAEVNDERLINGCIWRKLTFCHIYCLEKSKGTGSRGRGETETRGR